jgi:membrane fusion protein, heavy metal efflux system
VQFVNESPTPSVRGVRALSARAQAALIVVALAVAASVLVLRSRSAAVNSAETPATEVTSRSKLQPGLFRPTDAQWATLTVEPVEQLIFRTEHATEGKIAIDEDRSTPIFSPYAGRVMRLMVKPGDAVRRGQPLFTIEAADMVQAQNDFIAALTALNKARSALVLAKVTEKRQHDLYLAKAGPLKDWQQAEAALDAAQNDVRSGEVGLQATRNRLRILGKTEEEISAFENTGTISAETPIYAPIDGTIVQRKVGPGQYVAGASNDPVFVIGDLSTVWVVAYVRETEAPNMHVGQALQFTVLAYPDRIYPANVSYVATGLDPTSRRLLVRATVNNAERLLKPEMFASVTILTGEGDRALAVRRTAVIYEGDLARVWVARDDKTIELRRIKPGMTSGNMVQVLEGLERGDRVVTKGSLFIDRLAAGS